MTGMICNDNSLGLIIKYKNELLESTNVEISKDEMVGIDFILFRFWKKGLLDKLEDFDRQKAEIERLKKEKDVLSTNNQSLCLTIANRARVERAEAIKEFAERLKEKTMENIEMYGSCTGYGTIENIDNLVKEMEGESK